MPQDDINNITKLLKETISTLEWMILDMDYRNKVDNHPCDSPEMLNAKDLLDKLKKLDGVYVPDLQSGINRN
jgi:hypothetical protein